MVMDKDLSAVAKKWSKRRKKGKAVGGKLHRTKRFTTNEDSPIYDEKKGRMQRTEKAIDKPYN
jgi:hypothetical protein